MKIAQSASGLLKGRLLDHLRWTRVQIRTNNNLVNTTYTSAEVERKPPLQFNLKKRIEEMADQLKPPVANNLLCDAFLKVMIVGGPNQRSDYHIEMGEELFYQIKGNMHVDIIDPKSHLPRRIEIKEGEFFLLPRGIPHSPQRYENTLGLVIERERGLRELDCLRWYYPQHQSRSHTTHKEGSNIHRSGEQYKPKVWYEEYFHCTDLGTQLKPVIERFSQFKEKATLTDFNSSQASYSSISSSPSNDHVEKDSYIIALNDLPYCKSIQEQSLEPLPITSFLSDVYNTRKSKHCPSFIQVFNSEFVMNVFRGKDFFLSSAIGREKGEYVMVVPAECSSKEFLFYQSSGSTIIKRLTNNSIQEKETVLKEGDMFVLQDHQSSLEALQFTFSSPNDLLWCVYNNAFLD